MKLCVIEKEIESSCLIILVIILFLILLSNFLEVNSSSFSSDFQANNCYALLYHTYMCQYSRPTLYFAHLFVLDLNKLVMSFEQQKSFSCLHPVFSSSSFR